MQAQPIALFDFDGTFTRRDTLMPFLKHCVGPAAFYGGLVRQCPNLAGYRVGIVRNDVAKGRLLSYFFKGWEQTKLEELGQTFALQDLPKMVQPPMLAIFRWHQDRGHQCFLVSASLDVYLDPWARSLGFDAAICTRLEVSPDGRITGRFQGRNVHGAEKAFQIKVLLQNESPKIDFAYGDSRGDAQMLAMARHPWLKGRFLRGEPTKWLA